MKEIERQLERVLIGLGGVIALKASNCVVESQSFICLSVRISRNRRILHYFISKDIKIHIFLIELWRRKISKDSCAIPHYWKCPTVNLPQALAQSLNPLGGIFQSASISSAQLPLKSVTDFSLGGESRESLWCPVCWKFLIFVCAVALLFLRAWLHRCSDTFVRARVFLRGSKRELESQLYRIKSNGG